MSDRRGSRDHAINPHKVAHAALAISFVTLLSVVALSLALVIGPRASVAGVPFAVWPLILTGSAALVTGIQGAAYWASSDNTQDSRERR